MSPVFDALDPVLRRHGYQAEALLEVLAAAQQIYGHLSPSLLRHVAGLLRLPLSRVQGTASFYHLFRLSPPPRHQCLVCTGTACHVQGAGLLFKALQTTLKQPWCELGSVRCIGSCSGGPLLVVDGDIWTHQTSATALAGLRKLEP
jgi:bidirectional [NiFe] hydrogenase diaphorase subunit